MRKLPSAAVLALVLPIALAAPLAPAQGAVDSAPRAVVASSSAKVGVTAIEKRARRVIGLANRRAAGDLARLADADTVDFLLTRAQRSGGWRPVTPDCKRSVASSPGSPVYVCSIEELGSTHGWWLYFRQVGGAWKAVNHRLATSATVYRTEQQLAARRDRIVALAQAGRFEDLAPFVTAPVRQQIQQIAARVAESSDNDPIRTRFTVGDECRVVADGRRALPARGYDCDLYYEVGDDFVLYRLRFTPQSGQLVGSSIARAFAAVS